LYLPFIEGGGIVPPPIKRARTPVSCVVVYRNLGKIYRVNIVIPVAAKIVDVTLVAE
jgi:hypothetical protein